jgi:hypothetical protein
MHTVFPTGEDEAHGDCLLSMVSDALGCAKMPCVIFEYSINRGLNDQDVREVDCASFHVSWWQCFSKIT